MDDGVNYRTMTRWSQYYIPTLRQTPGDAEVVSHRLMLKAGLIRKVAAGSYALLPAGHRAVRKMEAVVRAEMDASGALEVDLPKVQPAELWQETGRWDEYGDLMLRDRHQRAYCFAPTAEEVIVSLVRHELRSYKDLPRNFYQIGAKYRDEIRPRFGLMRGREFGMKDAYSFDRDDAGLDRTFAAMEAAYRRIFARCGLEFRSVEAHSGEIGGDVSYEFHVLASSAEDAVVACSACDYAANIEKAAVAPTAAAAAADAPPTAAPEEVATPGKKTIDEVTGFLGITADGLIKTLLIEVDGDGPLAVLIRGDHELSEVKLTHALGGKPWRFAEAHQIERWTGGPQGFSGPVGLTGVRLLADQAVTAMIEAVVGANRADTHLRRVVPGRDFPVADPLDLRAAQAGDPCPHCGEAATVVRGIEVGHIFKLGTRYSQAMKATFLDQDGDERPFVMGCYGLGIGRTVAAAVEQSHDDDGIIWPLALAPFAVLITVLNHDRPEIAAAAAELAGELEGRGLEVLVDDRVERPGVKFKDGDLVGIPLRCVLSPRNLEAGKVEVSARRDRVKELVARDRTAAAVAELAARLDPAGAAGPR